MSVVLWVIVAIVALVVLLAVGGSVAQSRRMARSRGHFDARLRAVNRDLAEAHASDRGWQRDVLEDAARAAWVAARPGALPSAMTLVQVIDRPGTDEDEAVFEIVADGRRQTLRLGRVDGAWTPVPDRA